MKTLLAIAILLCATAAFCSYFTPAPQITQLVILSAGGDTLYARPTQ